MRTTEEIFEHMRAVEGDLVSGRLFAEACKARGIDEGTYADWKLKYGILFAVAKRMNDLESENKRLEAVVAALKKTIAEMSEPFECVGG